MANPATMARTSCFAFALLALASCSKEAQTPESQDAHVPIAFNVACALSTDVGSKSVTAVTGESLETFKCCAAKGEAGVSDIYAWSNVDFTRGVSDYSGNQYWPNKDPSYHFYASNANMTARAGSPPTVTVTNAQDIICAYLSEGIYRVVNKLNFEHIFSRADEMIVTAQEGYTASGITISLTPKTGGTYDILAGSGKTDASGWGGITEGATLTPISRQSITTAGGSIRESLNDIYLVPGTYGISATFTLSKGDYSITKENATGSVVIKKGKINTIKILLGGGDASEIGLSISVKDWGEPVNIDVTLS